MHNNYLHDLGRAGGSLPQQEVDVEGLEELLVVLGADTLILSDDRHLERRFFSEEFRKRRLDCFGRGLKVECSDCRIRTPDIKVNAAAVHGQLRVVASAGHSDPIV